jgi:hypothetical protein
VKLLAAYLAAAAFGALVGVVEVFQRYRAEPFQALWNRWGGLYVGFNAAVAAAAFAVADAAEGLSATSAGLALLQWSAAAGFGSSVLLRSKLLNVQLTGGKEVALGPEIVVQTFLAIIDRELDRLRARRRFDTVHRLFATVDFERSKLRLPLQVFQAMQGVTEEETQKLMSRVAEVDEMKTIGDQDKAFLLGFYLLDLVGEEFLAQVLDRYKEEFTAVAETPAPAPPGPAGGAPP